MLRIRVSIIFFVIAISLITLSESSAEICGKMRRTFNQCMQEKDIEKREIILKEFLLMECEDQEKEKKYHAHAHSALGDLYSEQANYDVAISEYHKAVDLDPFWIYPYDNIARVYGQLQRPKEADKYRNKAFVIKHYKTPKEIAKDLRDNTKGVAPNTRSSKGSSAIFFAFDSSELDAYDIKQLKALKQALNKYPQNIIKIDGHTCDKGTDNYNKNLSIERAKTVYDWLAQEGFSKQRMRYRGLGESKPLKPNTSDENRFWNRRVEIVLQ